MLTYFFYVSGLSLLLCMRTTIILISTGALSSDSLESSDSFPLYIYSLDPNYPFYAYPRDPLGNYS